jgi:hypothetical protein
MGFTMHFHMDASFEMNVSKEPVKQMPSPAKKHKTDAAKQPKAAVADKPAAHNATSNEQPRAPVSTEPRFIPHSPRFDIPPRMSKAPVFCLA